MVLTEIPHTRYPHTDLCPGRASGMFGTYRQFFKKLPSPFPSGLIF